MSTDNLFDIPAEQPDRLTQARNALARAERELAAAEEANEELPIGTKEQQDAVDRARRELRSVEQERLRRP